MKKEEVIKKLNEELNEADYLVDLKYDRKGLYIAHLIRIEDNANKK